MSEIDEDTLREYAENGLERPRDAMFRDDRCHTTHVPVVGWAEHGDDILEESNFLVAKGLIEGAAEDDEHVFEGSARHWLVGSLRQVWVQVYEEPAPPCASSDCERGAEFTAQLGETKGDDYCFEHIESGRESLAWDAAEEKQIELEDELIETDVDEDDFHEKWASIYKNKLALTREVPIERTFTAAFREAVSIAESLVDYPILDESDYSERENERFEENLAEALEWVQRDFVEDSDDEAEVISDLARDDLSELYGMEGNGDVSWGKVEEIYREHRDAYFEEKATEIRDELSRLGLLIKDDRPQAGPGQLELSA